MNSSKYKTHELGNTPLHKAIKSGDIEQVEILLQNGSSSINDLDSDYNSALHISFLYRYNKITDLLLDLIKSTSNYSNIKNNQGLSHLHIASARDDVEAIQGFIKAGVDVDDAVNTDSLSSWAGYTALHFAIEFRSLETAKFLMASGSRMENESNITGHLPLQLLQEYRKKYLIMSDHLDTSTFSYFHLACLKESVSIVKKFIDRGANLNETVKWDLSFCNGYSPLQCAIESPYDRKEKVQLLLSHGATVENKECLSKNNQMTALHLALYNECDMSDPKNSVIDYLYKSITNIEENVEDKNKLSYFHIAVTRNDFDIVKMYLDKGVNINQAVLENDRGFSGYTSLHFAVKYQQVDMAKFLIEHEANVNGGESRNCQTPLFEAFRIKNMSLIELLFKAGAKLHKFAADVSNNTLLHYAAEAGSHEIVQNLLDSGSPVDVQNDFGQTPLLKCVRTKNPSKKVIEILLTAGANSLISEDSGATALDIIDSSVWLNEDSDRFLIYKIFLERAKDLDVFQYLTSADVKGINMLLQTGIDPFKLDSKKNSLFHLFAENLNLGVIELLGGKIVDIDVRDKSGYTPLMRAACNANVNAVKFLLDEGADIEAAETETGQTSLYIAHVGFIHEDDDDEDEDKDEIEDFKNTIQLLLERGANAQIEIADNQKPTIFDIASLNDNKDTRYKLILAHLAIHETKGEAISELICKKIKSYEGFENYFEFCKKQLSVEIHGSVKLFAILSASQRKLERYLKNEELSLKLEFFQSGVDYFEAILDKRVPQAITMIGLRKNAAPVICTLMKSNYSRFPCIADEIASYLGKEDLECLISI